MPWSTGSDPMLGNSYIPVHATRSALVVVLLLQGVSSERNLKRWNCSEWPGLSIPKQTGAEHGSGTALGLKSIQRVTIATSARKTPGGPHIPTPQYCTHTQKFAAVSAVADTALLGSGLPQWRLPGHFDGGQQKNQRHHYTVPKKGIRSVGVWDGIKGAERLAACSEKGPFIRAELKGTKADTFGTIVLLLYNKKCPSKPEVFTAAQMVITIVQDNSENTAETALRYDCVFVEGDPDLPGFRGLLAARVLLFLSFKHLGIIYPCAVVTWFSAIGDEPCRMSACGWYSPMSTIAGSGWWASFTLIPYSSPTLQIF
ncbi:hypothetical protein B0H13DRAFT_1854847 [Mycena leptocephala]|nr:hypothetical protein B0H13DRAFT_1854847 [Mycena leptocephala]